MRCGRCGNENAETNRFCGMCGAILNAPAAQSPSPKPSATPPDFPAADSAPQRAAVAPTSPREQRSPASSTPPHSVPDRAARPSPAPTNPASSVSIRTPARNSYDEPSDAGITGPSFLGLNKPANSPGGFGRDRGTSHGDDLRSSGSVDYLLEDDEEPKSGWGKFVLILLALALAAGFGYLHWKQGGFDWLFAGNKQPAATQTNDSPQTNSDNGSAAQPAAPPSDNSAAAGNAPAAPSGTAAPATPAASDTPPANGGAQSSGAAANAPGSTSPAAQASSPQNSSAGSAPSSGSASSDASQSAPNAAHATSPDSPKQAQPDSDNSGSAPDDDSANNESEAAPKAAPATPIRRATPKPSPSRPVDSVSEAQRYIYGRGVPRDCDRGLRMLKSAAAQSNPQAMISLGTLYSTGTCAPRDLPTAYRWFAVALHKQPDNQALQNDLQSLWSQMTQPERQLAIKLSQ